MEYINNHFTIDADIAINELARRAGFGFNRKTCKWMTPFASIASRLGSPHCKDIIAKKLVEEKTALTPLETDFIVPTPKGKKLYSFQKAGVDFLYHHTNSLLADDMGSGKTIQTIGLMNKLTLNDSLSQNDNPTVCIVCPASLKLNWKKEIEEWGTFDLSIGIATGKFFPKTDIVIINYDIVQKHSEILRFINWELLVLDECHYLKNSKAKRTKTIVGFRNAKGITANRIIALSGTPIPNKPIELYNILKLLIPYGFPNKLDYAKTYCDAKYTRFGWDMSGASNLKSLRGKLRSTIMLRREKKMILKELPGKIRQIIELDEIGNKTVLKKNKTLIQNVLNYLGIEDASNLTSSEYRDIVKCMSGGDKVAFEEIATLRRETAIQKIPYIVEHLQGVLESGKKVVCFCHHTHVAQEIYDTFSDSSVMIVGSTPSDKRQGIVEDFQNNDSVKLFIGNIRAAGVGLTLTASSHVVFAETSWVPGDLDQAEDRCHRIGTKNSVLIQYLVFAESIEAFMLKKVVRKTEVIEGIMIDKRMNELSELLC